MVEQYYAFNTSNPQDQGYYYLSSFDNILVSGGNVTFLRLSVGVILVFEYRKVIDHEYMVLLDPNILIVPLPVLRLEISSSLRLKGR